MLRSLRSRSFALIAGLWFLAAGREPPFPHICEMGGTGSGAVAHDGESHRVGGAEHSGGHAHHMPDADAVPQPQAQDSQHEHNDDAPNGCECVDHCCVSVVAIGAAPAAPRAVALLPLLERRVAADAARPTDAAPRLLPFANGPPELT